MLDPLSFEAAVATARRALAEAHDLRLVTVLGRGYMIPPEPETAASRAAADTYNILAAAHRS